MTAFDSPLLVSKAAWLYGRPADRRSISVSEQQLLTLLERRRRKYLTKKESRAKLDKKKKKKEGFIEERDESDHSEHVHVLSDLSIEDPRCTGLGMNKKCHGDRSILLSRSSPHTLVAKATGPARSQAMVTANTRTTRARTSQNGDSKHLTSKLITSSSPQMDGNTQHVTRSMDNCVLNRYDCSELAEHVVHRAKVRLKRRQKKNLPVLMKNHNHDIQAKILSRSYMPSRLKATGTTATKLRVNNQRMEPIRSAPEPTDSQNGEHGTRQPTVPAQLKNSLSKRNDSSESTSICRLGRQLVSTENLSALSSSSSMTTRSFKVVYWSERHSTTPKETGVPNVPPVTPSNSYSQCFKFIPSMSDVKSQRQLKNRLQDIAIKLKQQSELLNDDAGRKNEEKRKQKEAEAKLKAQQRSEIYALNKIMAEFEEQKFQAFMSGKV